LTAPGEFTLELLKLGIRDSYVCLVPKPLDNTSSPPLEEQSDTGLTPAGGWALLKPLAGTCLYVCNLEALLVISFSEPITSTGIHGLPTRIVIITKYVNLKNWCPKAHSWQVSKILLQMYHQSGLFFLGIFPFKNHHYLFATSSFSSFFSL